MSATVFLPQGVAAAAPQDPVGPAPAAERPFVGPVPVAPEPRPVASSPAGPSSVAGFRLSGSATTGLEATTAPPVVAPAAVPPEAGPQQARPSGDRSPSGADVTGSGTARAGTTDPGATGTAGPATPAEPAPAPATAAPATAAPAVVVPEVTAPGAGDPTAGPSPWENTPPAGSANRPESGPPAGTGAGRDSASGSAQSGDTDNSGSRRSDDEDSSRGGSTGSYGGTTSADSTLGAAACPSTVGGGPYSATGSVTSGAAAAPDDTDTDGAASVTDPSAPTAGSGFGTVTRPTTQSFGGGLTSSVAGTVVGAGATARRAAGSASMPGDVLDLGYWYLTLPTGQEGSPDTIENPNLSRFSNEFFKLNPSRDGVVFSANADGVTTKNSNYPRSELREMNGSEKAAWTNTSGTHILDVCEAVTKVPSAKPHVVAAQIHDGNDDVIQIRLEGQELMVMYADGKKKMTIDPNYRLGTPYNVRIVAANSQVEVSYNGRKVGQPLPLAGSSWYWKVGAYVQSNGTKGDGADSTGEVTVYSLKCVHS